MPQAATTVRLKEPPAAQDVPDRSVSEAIRKKSIGVPAAITWVATDWP
jgi:hypothetical protein